MHYKMEQSKKLSFSYLLTGSSVSLNKIGAGYQVWV